MNNKIVYRVSWEPETLPFCCGVEEIGNFQEDEEYPQNLTIFSVGWFKTKREAWEAALKEMQMRKPTDSPDSLPLIFNFVKEKGDRAFLCDTLRQLVLEQPDQLFIHSWVNPKSGNMIEQYMLTNGSK